MLVLAVELANFIHKDSGIVLSKGNVGLNTARNHLLRLIILRKNIADLAYDHSTN